MFKKLLLTTSLLVSSTFGGHEYVDPDFSTLLTNRSDVLTADENGVVINIEGEDPLVIHRITKSEASDIPKDFNVLADAREVYFNEALYVQLICIELKADSTPRNGVTPEQDAALLSQLFWNRVSLFTQTLQSMQECPELKTDESAHLLALHLKNLTAFTEKHDSADTSVFSQGHYEDLNQLMNEFSETIGYVSSAKNQ